jgi:hypothetical protein
MSKGRARSRQTAALIVFVLVSVTLLLTSTILEQNHHPQSASIALNLGVSIAAVSIIEWLWRRFGGAPLEQQIQDFRSATSSTLGELRSSTSTLSSTLGELRSSTSTLRDLEETGIVRIYGRREQELDQRVDQWEQLAVQAKEIDLMGLTIHQNWFQHEKLCAALRRVLSENQGTIRVILLDRDQGSSIAQRVKQPGETRRAGLLRGLLDATYSEFEALVADAHDHVENKALQIRLIQECTLYALVIRIDDYMYVAPYVASNVGHYSLAMAINGKSHSIYQIYMKELDEMFRCGVPYRVNATDAGGVARER